MNSSRSLPSDVSFRTIRFSDNSELTSATTFQSDITGRKRLRISGDGNFLSNVTIAKNLTVDGSTTIDGTVNVIGSIPYVDDQTGWGLSAWTFANGSTYNKNTDSLIIKITNLETDVATNYATKTYVESLTTLNNGLVYAAPNTYPLFDGNGYYSKGVTHPASNTYFIIRKDTSSSQTFQIQTSDTAVGKFLRCMDADGTVDWQDADAVVFPTISGVNTENGPSTSSSFFVTDDVGVTRGFYFYPNLAANSGYNSRVQANDIALLTGEGNAQNGATQWKYFMGPYNGNQGIRMTSDYTSNSVLTRGSTSIYGGGINQLVDMSSSGITVIPELNKPILHNLKYDPSNTLNPQSMFHILSKDFPSSNTTPTMGITRKLNTSSLKQTIFVNPMMQHGNSNPVVGDQDLFLYAVNSTNFEPGLTFPVSPNKLSNNFHIGVYSDYADAFTVRQTWNEEYSELTTPNSGFTRMSGCSYVDTFVDDVDTKIPQNYLMMDRDGMSVKVLNNRAIQLFGTVKIKPYTGPKVNDPTTSTTLIAKLEVGTASQYVSSDFYGTIKYLYSGITGNITNYVLASSDSIGTLTYKPVIDVLPNTIDKAITFTNTITFADQITYTDSLPIMSANTLYCLGNDGTTGKVKWVKIPVSEDGKVEKPIDFTDAISLYNQMFFFDAGLLTAAAVGGVAYAIGSSVSKGSQSWSTEDSLLNFIWKFQDTSYSPPYTYSFKIDKDGVESKLIRAANSYPSADDYKDTLTGVINPNDIQFYLSNKTITDAFSKVINGVTYNVSVNSPGYLCVPGYWNYRTYNTSSGSYFPPAAGDILVNWGGYTFVPPNSEATEEYYGVGTWKNMSDVFPKSINWAQYFENDVNIGAETQYSVTQYGLTKTVNKNVANLSVFGKMFYRYAESDLSAGSSPANYYLTCLNATTGEIGWGQVVSTLPSSATFSSVTTGTLSVTNTASLSTVTISGTGTALQVSNGKISASKLEISSTDCSFAGFSCSGSITATTASCSVGALTANSLSSFENGVTVKQILNVNNEMYIVPNKAYGKVLTCTDANSGKAEWVSPTQSSYPQDISCNSLTTTKLIASSTNALQNTYNYSDNMKNWNCYAGQNLSSPPAANTLWSTTYDIIFQQDIPANTTRGYQYWTNLWCKFQWQYNANRLTTSEALNIYLTVYQVRVKFYKNNSANAYDERVIYPKPTVPSTGYTIRIGHDRYYDSTDYETYYTTVHDVTVFLYSIPIQFNVDFTNQVQNIRIEMRVEFDYQFQGVNISGTAAKFFKPATSDPYVTFFTQEGLNVNQDPVVYYTPNYNVGNYGFQAVNLYYGNGDINTATTKLYYGVYWDVDSNGSTSTGIQNAYVWQGGDRFFLQNFVSTTAFLSPDPQYTLLIGSANINSLNCQEFVMTNGVTYACGTACRKGFPRPPPAGKTQDMMIQSAMDLSGASNEDPPDNYLGSRAAWGNIFNTWWDQFNKLNFYIDYTWINALSIGTSDRRIKQNFRPAPSILDRLCQLPMYQFDFMKYEIINHSPDHVGFIADELQDLFPDVPHLITNRKDQVDADGKYVLQNRNDNEIISILIKAIQELREEVVQLKIQLGLS